jgi:hypothetical protein
MRWEDVKFLSGDCGSMVRVRPFSYECARSARAECAAWGARRGARSSDVSSPKMGDTARCETQSLICVFGLFRSFWKTTVLTKLTEMPESSMWPTPFDRISPLCASQN